MKKKIEGHWSVTVAVLHFTELLINDIMVVFETLGLVVDWRSRYYLVTNVPSILKRIVAPNYNHNLGSGQFVNDPDYHLNYAIKYEGYYLFQRMLTYMYIGAIL